jgi:hypothetical protein
MAQVCLSVWGETAFTDIDGQVVEAVTACRLTSFAMSSRVIFCPLNVNGKGAVRLTLPIGNLLRLHPVHHWTRYGRNPE